MQAIAQQITKALAKPLSFKRIHSMTCLKTSTVVVFEAADGKGNEVSRVAVLDHIDDSCAIYVC